MRKSISRICDQIWTEARGPFWASLLFAAFVQALEVFARLAGFVVP